MRKDNYLANLQNARNQGLGAPTRAGTKTLVTALGALSAAGAANGDIIWNADGDLGLDIRNDVNDSGKIFVDVYSGNDNPGVTFDGLDVYTQNIFYSLYQDTQTHGTFSGSKGDFMNSLTVGIGNESEVKSGWDTLLAEDGTVEWNHTEGGLPGIDYSLFNNTAADSSSDMGMTTYGIDWSVTDWNKDGSFNVADRDGLEMRDVSQYIASTGYEGGTFGREFDLHASQAPSAAIPEPAVLTLIGMAGLGVLAAKRFFGPKY